MKPFTTDCQDCDRLATFLAQTRRQYPAYFCKPVPAFGTEKPRLFVVGLAPGMHGANRTGRPFTGDFAGELLFSTLHKFGFASQPATVTADGELDTSLKLIGCRISNAVKCLPPQNKPTPGEIRTCNKYLAAEIAALPTTTAILTLGGIAHDAVLLSVGMKKSAAKFGHTAIHTLPAGQLLFNSYHCSRYNTNTRRLTEQTFHDVFRLVQKHLGSLANDEHV